MNVPVITHLLRVVVPRCIFKYLKHLLDIEIILFDLFYFIRTFNHYSVYLLSINLISSSYDKSTMEARTSSDRAYSAKADNHNPTVVNWKQRLDFLTEKDKITQVDDQTEETPDSTVSQEISTLEVDQELEKMMSKLERFSVVDLATKDRIADLFQEMQRIAQYLEQHDPHNDHWRRVFTQRRKRFQEILDGIDYWTPSESEPEPTEEEIHARLNWTACYEDRCLIHLSKKEGSGWFPKKPKRKASARG